MPAPRIIPALADLTQDIAGPLPLQLLQNWASGTQDPSTADKLLSEFRIEGHVVAADSSGLSLLTTEKDLLDVMSIISRPKGIVHALGREIGGRPIGIWVADNAEMYFPSVVAPLLLLDCLNEARIRIAETVTTELGFCVHKGVFYEIGGGLYGDDAGAVEHLAEEYAGPGEILVTSSVVGEVDGAAELSLERRMSLDEVHPPGVYLVKSRRRLPGLPARDQRYPHPFPEEFFDQLSSLPDERDQESARQKIYDRYHQERAVLFITRERSRVGSADLASLLDDLLLNAVTDAILKETLQASRHVAGSGGGLGILTFATAAEALDLAYLARARFAENGVLARIAIDIGSILMFEGIGGRNGISGDPVNMASKLSENVGQGGRILLTDRACAGLSLPEGAERFSTVVSRVRASGWIV
jgi:hypothetical protein